nr:MAG TPA: hypothetical protein [Caudoviricetes sp.]
MGCSLKNLTFRAIRCIIILKISIHSFLFQRPAVLLLGAFLPPEFPQKN